MKKIVVTGAAGIIGAILTETLLNRGYQVYAVVRPRSPHNSRIPEHPNVTVVPLLLEDIAKLPECIKTPCDAMIHLAWSSARNDFLLQHASFEYAWKAVDAARAIGCCRFLGIGSQAEYGIQNELTNEDAPLYPITPYGAFKASAFHVTKIRAIQQNMEWVWGRIFSVYGGYEPETSLLSYLLATLKAEKEPILTKATQLWDYLYVKDATEAILALLEYGKDGNVYNIANGNIHPLRYFVEQIHVHVFPNAVIHYGQRDDSVTSLFPSVKKIQQDTGWRAETVFIDGIKRMLAKENHR